MDFSKFFSNEKDAARTQSVRYARGHTGGGGSAKLKIFSAVTLKYFDSEMWCQFQEYIPEFDKDESFKRFIEVCSATVKGFHFKDWLKEFNYD